MILKFNEYINESKLYLSDAFIDILKAMNSPIAKVILDKNKVDIDKLSVNYIDMDKDKNDEASFTQDSRILRDLKSKDLYIKRLGGDWISSVEDNGGKDYSDLFEAFGLKKDDFLNFCMNGVIVELVSTHIAKADGIEYALCKDILDNDFYIIGKNTLEKETDIENRIGLMEKYYTMWRNKMKIGRLVRSILKDIGVEANDKDIEAFVNEYKGNIDKLNNIEQFFELVSGEDIKYWYHVDNYLDEEGSLGGSCMRYDECQDYLSIYTDNKSVDLLILKSPNNDEKIIGRALIWTLTDGSTFMDRVYVYRDFYDKIFKDYASKNGWSYKKYNNSSEDCVVVSPDGTESEKTLEAKVNGYAEDKYPYADTLKFYYIFDKKISNKADKKKDYIKIEDTEGGIDKEDYGCKECHGESERSCSNCGGDGNISEECPSCEGSGQIKDECSDCEGKGKVECDECEGSAEVDCDECNGSGKDGEDECSNCDGTGMTTCFHCEGGRIECSNCDGDGEIEADCGECEGNGYISEPCENCDGRGYYSRCGGRIHGIIDEF
jgi:hypothetical protein